MFEAFFGGARGGGKTDGVLGDFLEHADTYGADAIGLMVRKERTQLIETIERSRAIYTLLGWKFHEQDKMWRAPNGARLRFAYLERDADAEAYQGHSYTRVYIEEITNFPTQAPVMKLMATLRSGVGVPCGFRATGNPGGPGHQWVKARYIDPAPRGWKVIVSEFINPFTKEIVTRDRVYIPSRLSDNQFLGNAYVAQLQMSGNANLVKAWLEGDWSVIDGAFFDCWSTEKHVLAPFAIPDDWLRFRSADWGFASPFSVGWWAVASDDYQPYPVNGHAGAASGSLQGAGNLKLPRGALVRYREWYGSSAPGIGLRLTAEQVADGIISREKSDPKLAFAVLDPSAFKEDGGPSIGERINGRLMAEKKAVFRGADNARISQRGAMGGWDQMRARMVGDGDRPMLYTFSTCVDSIRSIPVLQHDPDRPEDLDTNSEDHAADDWRYACMSRPWVKLPKAAAANGKTSGYSHKSDETESFKAY